jgi:hypothetical protein
LRLTANSKQVNEHYRYHIDWNSPAAPLSNTMVYLMRRSTGGGRGGRRRRAGRAPAQAALTGKERGVPGDRSAAPVGSPLGSARSWRLLLVRARMNETHHWANA